MVPLTPECKILKKGRDDPSCLDLLNLYISCHGGDGSLWIGRLGWKVCPSGLPSQSRELKACQLHRHKLSTASGNHQALRDSSVRVPDFSGQLEAPLGGKTGSQCPSPDHHSCSSGKQPPQTYHPILNAPGRRCCSNSTQEKLLRPLVGVGWELAGKLASELL